ncbi:hypothetical protein BKA56DRAFT_528243 [Ilyonectria sp. MPI-CAGE-AT-0026]|nr:hypothetical protein BKA56DRAFT_528243 [Ilyonectria sp. MPI-CAGE-AT-0026]
MSWLHRSSEIFKGNIEVLTFKPRESRVFTIEREDGALDTKTDSRLSTEDEWRDWLDQNPSKESTTSSRINLIIGSQEKEPRGHCPALASKMPWSKSTFLRVNKQLFVHAQIVRTINRSTSCMFSRMWFDWESGQTTRRSLVYTCRTAASWPQDMALSVTFFPDTLTTHAVVYSCDMKTPDMYCPDLTLDQIIVSRLSNSDTPVLHPMLLPAIFADIERDRQIELVRTKLSELVQRITHLTFAASLQSNSGTNLVDNPSGNTSTANQGQTRMFGHSLPGLGTVFSWLRGTHSATNSVEDEKKAQESPSPYPPTEILEPPTARLWLQISHLRNGLGNWQCQLRNMMDHVEELETTEFASDKPSNYANVQQFREVGVRIRERLQELVDEYDEYIRECTIIMEGLTLATQLELSQIGRNDAKTNFEISKVNLEVAQLTRRDSSVMKSIAVLGMIFLPATFVTAFFSMGFFDWNGDEPSGGGPSGYIWIYAIAVVALTLLSVGLFYIFSLRARHGQERRNPEKLHSAV